jgi:hypothetical protein
VFEVGGEVSRNNDVLEITETLFKVLLSEHYTSLQLLILEISCFFTAT